MRWAFFLVVAGVLFAQGTATRPTPSAYTAQATAGDVTFAADFMVRSIPVPDGVLVSRGYLVVDLAVFSRVRNVNLSTSYFSLHLNGNKNGILAQQPFMVANSFDYRRPDPGASQGGTIFVGTGPNANPNGPPVPPGQPDPRVPEPSVRNTPPPRRVPDTPNPYSKDQAKPEFTPHEQVERAALPTGDVVPPISGALFFAYSGKPESIKSVELRYDGPAGKAALRLR